jgi:chaperone required for assembly of F1-ATPase
MQEGGLAKSLTGMSMDMQKWNQFMDTNPIAIRAVDAIIDTKSPVEIMKRFKNKLKPEDAVALAKADSVDAVKKVLVRKYAIGNETLSTSIYDIQPTLQ